VQHWARASLLLAWAVLLIERPDSAKSRYGRLRLSLLRHKQRVIAPEVRFDLAADPATLDDLGFSPERDLVERAEAAVKEVGLLLGFEATRPEKETGTGPDGHWPLTPKMSAVIELRTGTSRQDTDITKDEIGQLATAVSWDNEVNETEQRVPVMLSRSECLHAQAFAPVGTRIITPDDLNRLKTAILAFAADVAKNAAWKRPEAVTDALARHS